MIKIASPLRPFSHQPKTTCLIPGTEILVEAYPALVLLKDFDGRVIQEIELDIKGPLKQFTLMQNLERGCVTVFSEYYRFHILPNCEVSFTKNPHLSELPIQERLSLGSHKKQEWEEIKRRADFREIFPIWFRLGSLLNLEERKERDAGIFCLLNECKAAIESHRPERVLPAFQKLYLTGFRDLFVPRLRDEEFQGIVPQDMLTAKSSPLYLLTEGAALIRSLFLVSSDNNEFSILPNLPPEFFAGRMLKLSCPPFGELDLEWTKKSIRRLEFRAEKDGEIHLHFHSALRAFRVRSSTREKGQIYTCGEPLEIKSGNHYLLDQFQK